MFPKKDFDYNRRYDIKRFKARAEANYKMNNDTEHLFLCNAHSN